MSVPQPCVLNRFSFTRIKALTDADLHSYIASLDAKTGASLKLTILNSTGRVWTLVAGGGASVVYADAIASAGYASGRATVTIGSFTSTLAQKFIFWVYKLIRGLDEN